jgi:2-polyprenyl-6-methoxyphenol hydroxylase-like FAD-dependent oxidoreductase
VLVAGAGPASLFFTLRLLQLNPSVKIQIHESRSRPPRYSDPTNGGEIAGDNAFGFGLGARAQSIFQKIPGVFEAVERVGEPSRFRVGSWMVNRRDFCAELIYKLEQDYGIHGEGRLELCFNSHVQGLGVSPSETDDVESCCYATVADTTRTSAQMPTTRDVPYSLLIAADGTRSAIRSRLLEQGYLTGQKYLSQSTWKALQLPAQPNMQPSSMISFTTRKDLGVLLPRLKNRFVLLTFRKRKYNQQSPFDAETPDDVKEAFKHHFPDVTEFPSDDVLQSFLDSSPGETGYMQLNRHCVPEFKVSLIGDAAVGMYSLLGQGCASALQNANLLAEQVAPILSPLSSPSRQKENAEDPVVQQQLLEQALYSVSNTTVAEGRAIADMNLIGHATNKPIVKLFVLPEMGKISKSLSLPDVSYTEMLQSKSSKLAIFISKFFWRLERISVPIIDKNSP